MARHPGPDMSMHWRVLRLLRILDVGTLPSFIYHACSDYRSDDDGDGDALLFTVLSVEAGHLQEPMRPVSVLASSAYLLGRLEVVWG